MRVRGANGQVESRRGGRGRWRGKEVGGANEEI